MAEVWSQEAYFEDGTLNEFDSTTGIGLSATEAAAMTGTYGMSVAVTDATARYGSFTDPDAETAVTVEFELDPNLLTMGNNENFNLVFGVGVFIVFLRYSAGSYQIYALAGTDAGSEQTAYYNIADEPHKIRLTWFASTGVGEDNGYMELYIDDVLKEAIVGLDTDTKSVDEIRFGSAGGLDAGTYGIFYMDDCKWSDELYPILQHNILLGSNF